MKTILWMLVSCVVSAAVTVVALGWLGQLMPNRDSAAPIVASVMPVVDVVVAPIPSPKPVIAPVQPIGPLMDKPSQVQTDNTNDDDQLTQVQVQVQVQPVAASTQPQTEPEPAVPLPINYDKLSRDLLNVVDALERFNNKLVATIAAAGQPTSAGQTP